VQTSGQRGNKTPEIDEWKCSELSSRLATLPREAHLLFVR
jgi:hypothetical protein